MMNSNRERRRILLVEDEEDAREIVAFVLEAYSLFYARDFNEGLLAVHRGYFDLYILDNWLPDGNGVELCRLIREFDPHTPIIFYSAAGYAHDIREALRAGAQEYFVKPVSSDDLKQAVAQLTFIAGERDFEARLAGVAAVREELAIRHAENAERIKSAREKRLRAEEKVIRLKAEMAFLAAGGTRGAFARAWPSVLLKVVRGPRTPPAVSGN